MHLTLESLLNVLLPSQSMWVVIFEWHCDQIDNVYSLDINLCISKLKKNLEFNEVTEGFIVLSP